MSGVLAALFALLVIVVVVNAMLVWYRAPTIDEPLPSSEAPAAPSKIIAPAGLVATAEENKVSRRGLAVEAAVGALEVVVVLPLLELVVEDAGVVDHGAVELAVELLCVDAVGALDAPMFVKSRG